jgi:hypothetical protein
MRLCNIVFQNPALSGGIFFGGSAESLLRRGLEKQRQKNGEGEPLKRRWRRIKERRK